jgi:hypothetical protein
MRPFGVFVAQPFERLLYLAAALPCSQDHLAVITANAEIEPKSNRSQPIARSCTRTSCATITADFSPRCFRSTSVTFVGH